MKGILLLSGGIDSPVAAYLMLKQGVELVLLHCGKEKKNLVKIKKLAKLLNKFSKKKIDLYSVNFEKIQKEIVRTCERHYTCLFCKRFMYRIAEALCNELNFDFIVTGENLGQVASQTMQNLIVNNSAIKVPVIRPLIAMDKDNTIKIAKQIGTYEISIEKGVPCVFVPKHPSTQAKLDVIEAEEKKINIDSIVKKSLKQKRKIKY